MADIINPDQPDTWPTHHPDLVRELIEVLGGRFVNVILEWQNENVVPYLLRLAEDGGDAQRAYALFNEYVQEQGEFIGIALREVMDATQ